MAEFQANRRNVVVDPKDLAAARALGARACANNATRAPVACKDWMDLVAQQPKSACKLADAFTEGYAAAVDEEMDRAECAARAEWVSRSEAERC